MRSFLVSWRSYFILLGGVAASVWVSYCAESRWLLPVLMTLALYPFFVADLVLGERILALRHVFFWFLVSSVLVIAVTRIDPAGMGRLILRGVPYRDKMFRWILTGEGSEENPNLFIPEHLKHFAIFSIVTLLTGGFCGLAFGSILFNYMNFYVGSLSLKMDPPLLAYLFGWPVWSLFRVVGFVVGGVALSCPLLSLSFRLKLDWRAMGRWLLIGIFLGGVDILLKGALAPFWRDLLRRGVRL